MPHQLLVMTDLSKTLRQEERQTWQRLIRVLGHELNNSLGPIKSTAETLHRLTQRQSANDEWHEDLRSGLEVIRQRSEALSRFMASYSQLARLPEPALELLVITEVVKHAAAVESRLAVKIVEGPALTVQIDRAQIEQALINIVKNAVDASLETGGQVEIGWSRRADSCEIRVQDEGLGLPESANLFVPFFTTKPGGSGIGLVLSRQIAEAHGGSLTVENRIGARGCLARLRLPLG
jgi:two-component system nitrogen regulation sensor histidine kinase NtrY